MRPLLAVTTAALPLPALLLPALLAACAPRAAAPAAPVTASTTAQGVSFYPQEIGLSWTYLPENDPADAAPYTLRTLGPTRYAGQTVQAFQLTGRGAQQTWYRTFTPGGTYLLGIQKPGVNLYLNPPMQESPAPDAWRIGLTWQGQSQLSVSGDDGKVQTQGTVNYTYLVQAQRQVTTPGGTFSVWVVTRQMSDTLGGLFPATQQYWFTPYVGDIRTAEGLLLTGRNFRAEGR